MSEFIESWLTEPIFSGWLEKVIRTTQLGFCNVCNVDIPANKDDLIEHCNNQQHKEKVESSVRNVPETSVSSVAVVGSDDDHGNSTRPVTSACAAAAVAIERAYEAVKRAEDANKEASAAVQVVNDALSVVESTVSAIRENR